MTTNSNTADDAIFDSDSDVTDVDTGAVGVAAVRTPTAPVPDCACWAVWPTIRALSRCPRRRWRGSRAGPPPGRDLLRTAPPSTISTCIEFCNFRSPRPASRSQVLVPALERRLEDINAQLDVPITININRAPAA